MMVLKSEADAHRLFTELSAGGKVEMTLEKMFWGDLFGSSVDRFCIRWMIDHAIEKQA